jgi:hypothetical protein
MQANGRSFRRLYSRVSAFSARIPANLVDVPFRLLEARRAIINETKNEENEEDHKACQASHVVWKEEESKQTLKQDDSGEEKSPQIAALGNFTLIERSPSLNHSVYGKRQKGESFC